LGSHGGCFWHSCGVCRSNSSAFSYLYQCFEFLRVSFCADCAIISSNIHLRAHRHVLLSVVSGLYGNTVKIWDPASGQCLQTLQGDRGSAVSSVAFSMHDPERHGYSWGGGDQTWIIYNGRNLVWLPPEYRPGCSAVQGQMVAIGCASGRVFTIGFSCDV
jgi:WD40 repeat protein